MEFSRQEYWSVFPRLSPGDLPDPGIEPGSPTLQADSLLSEPPRKPLMGHLLSVYRVSAINLCYLINIDKTLWDGCYYPTR